MQVVETAADFQIRHGVSRETLDRLCIYAETITVWQRAINLVSPTTINELWQRHFSDSAQLVRLVPLGHVRTWMDLGSGAGFPALVVAALLAETEVPRRIVLVESDSKKCAFLREVVRKMALGPSVTVDILSHRIESDAVSSNVGIADVVSARALAPLTTLFGLSERFFGRETVGVFPKGKDAELEVTVARKTWSFDVDLVPSVTDSAAKIVVARRLVRAVMV